MTLVLHHASLSSCSQKVRRVLAEKQLEFESCEIDRVGGGQHAPEYGKLDPNHVVSASRSAIGALMAPRAGSSVVLHPGPGAAQP
jgi:hypothetical protein